MKLQILIPQYRENEAIVKKLLDSIALQQNVDFMKDFSVIICNDGTDVILDQDFLNSYPYSVFYMAMATHSGVSAVRNALMDAASADYIMFCDADDMFLNVCGIWTILQEIEKDEGFDFLVSAFTEEIQDAKTGKVVFFNHENDYTFIHGKVYRLVYLRENNIRFNESLQVHEDGYFNLLCNAMTENTRYCPMLFYLWKWRGDSTCREDPKYLLKTYPQYVDQNEALVEELLGRGKRSGAVYYATSLVYDIFYTLNKPEWLREDSRCHREALESRFIDFFSKYRHLYEEADENTRLGIIKEKKDRAFRAGVYFDAFTFADWIQRITEKG